VLIDDRRQEHGELVTAEPTRPLGQPGSEARTDVTQELVARLVTEGVVHLFEVVEVDEQHRRLVGVGTAARDAGLEVAQEPEPVLQIGQRVVDREFLRIDADAWK
jgi:hypothetical protein